MQDSHACCCCCSVTRSGPTLQLHGLQQVRSLCSPLSPRVCANSCPLSLWCYLNISSSAAPSHEIYPISRDEFENLHFSQLPRWFNEITPSRVSIMSEVITEVVTWGPLFLSILTWFFQLTMLLGPWVQFSSVQFSSVAQSSSTLCDPMDCSTSGFPNHHQLWGPTQTHVHRAGDAIQPSHPLSSPFPSAFNLSQNQGLFQWICSLHQVAKVLVPE